jgi:glutaredoxin-related protein
MSFAAATAAATGGGGDDDGGGGSGKYASLTSKCCVNLRGNVRSLRRTQRDFEELKSNQQLSNFERFLIHTQLRSVNSEFKDVNPHIKTRQNQVECASYQK